MIDTIERHKMAATQTPYRDFFTKAEEEYEEKCHTAALRKQHELRHQVTCLLSNMSGMPESTITPLDFIGSVLEIDGIRFRALEDLDVPDRYHLHVQWLCKDCGQRPHKRITEAHEVLPSLRELEKAHGCKCPFDDEAPEPDEPPDDAVYAGYHEER